MRMRRPQGTPITATPCVFICVLREDENNAKGKPHQHAISIIILLSVQDAYEYLFAARDCNVSACKRQVLRVIRWQNAIVI